MNRQQGRQIKPLKQRRWKFDEEMLDRFEDLDARRQAGHHSYQACMAGTPEYYAFQADSKFLQLTLLKLLFHAVCGGVFNTEPEPAEEDKGFFLFGDCEYLHDVRQRLLAAVEERRRKRT